MSAKPTLVIAGLALALACSESVPEGDGGAPLRCAVDCECPQGDACIDGSCTTTATPIYCCENAGCPSGDRCVSAAGTLDVCPECNVDCDCPQGQACTASGACVETTEPTWCCDNAGCPLGEACIDTNGASSTCVECESPCDCPQGRACSASGLCIETSAPTWCCDNPGCPTGESCLSAAGTAAQCGGGAMDAGAPGDAGPTDTDAGPTGTDAGPTGTDAGPTGTDAGPTGTDAGPLVTHNVGQPCDGRCAICLDAYPGTFCTGECSSDTDCPGASHCVGEDLWTPGICMADCTSTCTRAEYGCFDRDGDGSTECVPLATGRGAVGSPCTEYRDCAGGAEGWCDPERSGRFRGGYCRRTCEGGCPAGSTCANGGCWDICTGPATCRGEGYACAVPLGGDESTTACLASGTNESAEVGDGCAGTWECSGGRGAECRVTQPGGYCTLICTEDSDCDPGSHCANDTAFPIPIPIPGLFLGLCVEDCANDATCRRAEGYSCADHLEDATPRANECWAP